MIGIFYSDKWFIEELSTVYIDPTLFMNIYKSNSRSERISIEVLTKQTSLALTLMYNSQMSFTSPPWPRHTDLYLESVWLQVCFSALVWCTIYSVHHTSFCILTEMWLCEKQDPDTKTSEAFHCLTKEFDMFHVTGVTCVFPFYCVHQPVSLHLCRIDRVSDTKSLV